MKNKAIAYVFFTTLHLLISCSNNTFEEILFRSNEDPFYETLITDSLSLENTVFLKWREDENADGFFLMKADDKSNLVFKCIYEGRETAYTDTAVLTDCRYVYRLDKKRGNKYFEGKAYSYGYGCQTRNDLYENNDTEENAALLDNDLICNLPCVQYITEGVLQIDADWFYLPIPPRRTAEILVSQKGLSNTAKGTTTSLMFQERGKTSEQIKEKTALCISNSTNRTENFYFKIFPDSTNLFTESSGTAVFEYTVSLSQIINYKL